MKETDDEVSETIAKVISKSQEPLETKEVQGKVNEILGDISRSKVLYRLNDLRGQGKIAGKYIGSGKGVWIWWNRRGKD